MSTGPEYGDKYPAITGWGFPRDKLKPGIRLLQAPKGERAYIVETLEEKYFTMKNLETGFVCRESYEWLYLYRELGLSNGKSEIMEDIA